MAEIHDPTTDATQAEGSRRVAAKPEAGELAQASIPVEGGRLPEVVSAVEQGLIRSGVLIFQRGGQLVRVIDADPGGQLVRRPEGVPMIVPVDAPWLADRATTVCQLVRYDSRAQKWKAIDCPERVAKALLSRSGDWHFPVLRGITQAPTLRPDGSLVHRVGYDWQSGLLSRHEININVPDNPSRESALQELEILRQPFAEFPFATPADEAAAIAAMLTILVRPSLPTAPLFLIDSPTAGTGKGLLVDCIAIVATGRSVPTLAVGRDEAELEKRLGAALLAGDPVVSLDNIERPLEGDFLCQVLTQPTVQTRILGLSKRVECPTGLTMFATGNNARVRGDTTRRTLGIHLDAECEKPDARTFAIEDLRAWVAAHRSELIEAALTILRAHHVEGQPFDGKPLGSFESWSRWIRGAVTWLGLPDPERTQDRLRSDDPAADELAAVIEAWRRAFGSTATTVQVAAERAEHDPDLGEALGTIASGKRGIDTRRLGWWMRRNMDVICDGYVIRRRGGSRTAWAIEPTGDEQ